MKHFLNKIKTVFAARPTNAFLLFIIGLLFSLFMLTNALYIIHPFGGWVTFAGTFTTASILYTLLFALSVSLFALWRSVNKVSVAKQSPKTRVIKIQKNYSPIDYPKGSTQAVVSGYAVA